MMKVVKRKAWQFEIVNLFFLIKSLANLHTSLFDQILKKQYRKLQRISESLKKVEWSS